jgi:hypothetical protein
MTARTMHETEARLRAELTTLARRWQRIADYAPEHPKYLSQPTLTVAERAEHDQGVAYRKAAEALFHVLNTGLIPQELMTEFERRQHGIEESTS